MELITRPRLALVMPKTATIKLRKGTYRYVCDPHSGQMHGSFRVG